MIECLGPLPGTYAPGTDDVEFEKASASKVGRLVVKQNFEASHPSLNEPLCSVEKYYANESSVRIFNQPCSATLIALSKPYHKAYVSAAQYARAPCALYSVYSLIHHFTPVFKASRSVRHQGQQKTWRRQKYEGGV